MVVALLGAAYLSGPGFAVGVGTEVSPLTSTLGPLPAVPALGALPDAMGAPLSLERLLGWLMAPLAWLLGIPWAEASAAGALIGTKVVLNELIAYLNLAQMPPDALGPRSRVIVVYALCSFGNFAGLGIMLAGLIAMAPERKGELIGLGLKSLLAGNMAAWMTAAIVALIV